METLYDLILKQFNYNINEFKAQVECVYLHFISELEEKQPEFILAYSYTHTQLKQHCDNLCEFNTVDILLGQYEITDKSYIILKDKSWITIEICNQPFQLKEIKLQLHSFPGIPEKCKIY